MRRFFYNLLLLKQYNYENKIVEAEEKIAFIMGDKIPTHYDVAISLFHVSARCGDQGKKVINSYYKSLVNYGAMA